MKEKYLQTAHVILEEQSHSSVIRMFTAPLNSSLQSITGRQWRIEQSAERRRILFIFRAHVFVTLHEIILLQTFIKKNENFIKFEICKNSNRTNLIIYQIRIV